jgi:transcriptional regulator with XRE-family HTH domain
MVATSSPTVWRRWLAFELRRRREERGLAQREVGKACGWSGARLSYIENAQQNVVEDDLDKLLPLYGVPEDEWPRFREAAERSREKGFWERYDERVVPGYVNLLIGLEQGAASIQSVDPVLVPGLLQTPEYTTALLRSDVIPRTEQQIARMVEIRQARQGALMREEGPLELSVVLDESALRRPAGGPKAMADQIDHLATMAERTNVTIRVMPFDRGVNVGMLGASRILAFPWDPGQGVVYIEYRDGAVYLDDAPAVDNHRLVFEHLCNLALEPEPSRAMLRALSEEYLRRA